MRERFFTIIDAIRYPLLLTINAAGYPHARPMILVARDRTIVWFATARQSTKISEIEANPRVTVLFAAPDRFTYACLYGTAVVVNDPPLKAKLWREEWRENWPDGPADPNYVLIKVSGKRGSYYYGDTDETQEFILEER